jgi:hypothetical protein
LLKDGIISPEHAFNLACEKYKLNLDLKDVHFTYFEDDIENTFVFVYNFEILKK